MLLLHILHILNTLAWAVVYAVLVETSPAFSDAMTKIEKVNGFKSSWAICLGCPVACVFSILARLLYNQVEPWNIVNRSLKQSSCFCPGCPPTLRSSCCPPSLRSSFKTITIEELKDPDTPAAEVEEMLDYLAHNRR